MRRILLVPLLLLPLGAAPPASAPRRVVSLNLCADQYLLALADRSQLAALTALVRDPTMSAAADRARGLPVTRGGAEDVLALRPDLVIAAPGLHRDLAAYLRGHGVPILDLPPADSYADVRRQVGEVAAAVGRPARGAALVARMDRALAALPRDAGHGATAAYYQRRGFLTGRGTLVDELLHRLGLRNLAARLGKPPLARVGLEEMALARPDWLVVESDSEHAPDRGAEMLRHPLLARIPRLRVPQSWTVCGGPAYVRAARSLAAQLRRRD